jgi:HAE1 family hydrophobic/amphiphilic exporter-1
MWLTRFALRNPIAIVLFYVIVAMVGVVAFARMGRGILPPVSFAVVSVTARYPGAGPSEMERLIVAPIEERLEGVADLERVSSYSQDGIAQIVARFHFGSSLQSDRSRVQQAVDAARATMPADALPPVVSEDDPSQAPVLQAAIGSAILSPRALAALIDRRVAPAVRAAAGVGAVRVSGEATRQFTVVPRPAALDAVGMTALDLERTLASAADTLPGGRLSTPYREAAISVEAAAENAAQLRALPVLGSGGAVRLGDVARVVDGYATPSTLTRVDGEPAIVLDVSRARSADALTAIASAQRVLRLSAKRYPMVRFDVLRTDAPATRAAIDGVLQTLLEGVVLTVLVMLAFLHAWRSAAIAAIAIPSSLLATFVAMWIAGFTIDVLSLMGLSLTIGILVDDSIVIIEAIARYTKSGFPPQQAALAGRKELGGAAIAITLIDVAVFAPIAFMGGLAGEFMREFGLAVVFATAFSLLVALTLTPLLTARWVPPQSVAGGHDRRPWMLRSRAVLAVERGWRRFVDAFAECECRVVQAYAHRALPFVLRRSRMAAAATIALLALSLVPLATGAIGSEFSPPLDRGQTTVDMQFPAGTPLARADRRSALLASALLADPAVAHVVTSAGRGFNGSTDVISSNLVAITAMLRDPTAPVEPLEREIVSLSDIVPEARVAGSGRGMGGSAPIRYTLAGEPGAVDEAAARIAAVLRADPRAADVRVSDAGMTPHVELTVDSAKALALGVSTDDAAQTARIATGGAIAARLRLPDGLADVLLQSDATHRGDLRRALDLTVRDRTGRLVPLADVVDVKRGRRPAVIERENGERVVSVTANARSGVPIGRVAGPLARTLQTPGFLPDGVRVETRGDVEQFVETAGKILEALALAVGIVYAILAVLYRSYRLPLVIMGSVPLAAIGAFLALYVFGQPIDLYSMLGIVMLVGLVSKNGILLIEYAERETRSGAPAALAVQRAAERRFRPIVMTTLAMIAGMLPLALGDTIGAEYRQAMGVVVIGGLSSSLLLTLFIVPAAYVRFRSRNPLRCGEALVRREPDATAAQPA